MHLSEKRPKKMSKSHAERGGEEDFLGFAADFSDAPKGSNELISRYSFFLLFRLLFVPNSISTWPSNEIQLPTPAVVSYFSASTRFR